MGARLGYLHRTPEGDWRLAADVDVWTPPPGSAASGLVHLRTSARVEALGVPEVQPSLRVEHHNKRLGEDGPGRCFEGTEGTLPDGEPAPCSGERYRVTGRVRLQPSEDVSFVAQYQHTWVGSRQRPGDLQQDGAASLEAIVQPMPALRLHARANWRDEDVSDNTRLSQGLRTSMEVAWAPWPGWSTRARYELALDLKSAVGARTPPDAPRHLFRLELEGLLTWSRP